MKRKELTVMPGGLYRCCIQTAFEWIGEAPDQDVEDGETFACRYERDAEVPAKMVATQGKVLWLDPDIRGAVQSNGALPKTRP